MNRVTCRQRHLTLCLFEASCDILIIKESMAVLEKWVVGTMELMLRVTNLPHITDRHSSLNFFIVQLELMPLSPMKYMTVERRLLSLQVVEAIRSTR